MCDGGACDTEPAAIKRVLAAGIQLIQRPFPQSSSCEGGSGLAHPRVAVSFYQHSQMLRFFAFILFFS